MYVLHPSAILWKMVVLEVFLRGLLILNPHLCHNSLLNAVLGVQIIGADKHVHTARGYIRHSVVLECCQNGQKQITLCGRTESRMMCGLREVDKGDGRRD